MITIKHRNAARFATPLDVKKQKKLSASGGLRPPGPLTRGSAPGPRWGLCPQTPDIGSRYRVRHVAYLSRPTFPFVPMPIVIIRLPVKGV